MKTVRRDETTGKFTINLTKKPKSGRVLKYNPEELDFLLAYSPYHNAIIRVEGKEVWDKSNIQFSSAIEGNYSGTSRFIEDYIVFKFA